MAWPKCNAERITEMHTLYTSGRSLQEVATAYGVTRQSVYELFKNNGKEMRRKKPLPYLIYNGNKYTLRNTGYYGKTNGRRTLMHRDVWKHSNGQIPVGYDIHHKDGNKENNQLDNLECLPKSEHTQLYSPHNNQYTKGRKR